MNEPLRDASGVVEDTSTRREILVATAEVLGRSGQTKLSLSRSRCRPASLDRRCIAGSPPRELLDAFGLYEREMFDSGIGRATAGLRGTEKLDAALRFIVEYQHSCSGVRLVDIEPEVVIAQLSRIIPIMRARLLKLMPDPMERSRPRRQFALRSRTTSSAATLTDQFLAQLRHAAGLKQNG